MNTTTRAKSTDPRQIPFTPSAGFVQAIAFRVRCVKCGEARPGGIQCCPCCGHTRNGLAGAPYPRGRLDRYRWAFDQEIADGSAKAALVALVHFDRGGAAGIFPSQALLARMTGFSERTIRRAVDRLESDRWIVRIERRHRGWRASDLYTIQQAETAASPDFLPVKMSGSQPAKMAG